MEFRFVDGPMSTSRMLFSRAQARVSKAVAHFANRINSVEVHVSDINGPKGGVDKRCRIQATASGAGVIVVESSANDFYAAVNGAASKLARALEHRLSRSRRGR